MELIFLILILFSHSPSLEDINYENDFQFNQLKVNLYEYKPLIYNVGRIIIYK